MSLLQLLLKGVPQLLAVSAGVDFVSNWITLRGKDYKTAFRSISWGEAAAVDGLAIPLVGLVHYFCYRGSGNSKNNGKNK